MTIKELKEKYYSILTSDVSLEDARVDLGLLLYDITIDRIDEIIISYFKFKNMSMSDRITIYTRYNGNLKKYAIHEGILTLPIVDYNDDISTLLGVYGKFNSYFRIVTVNTHTRSIVLEIDDIDQNEEL